MNMKRIKILAGLIITTFVSLLFMGCGSDDKKDGGGGNGGSSVENALIGYWFGYDTGNEGFWLTMNLKSSGYADFKLIKSNVSENYTVANYSSLPWRYNSSKGHIFLYTSSNEGYAFPLLSLSSNAMTVSVRISGRDVTFSMERSNDSGGGGSSGGGSSGGGSSSGTKCKYCQGNGKCNFYTSLSGNKYYCHGSGKCQYCGGDGLIDGIGGFNNVDCPNCDYKSNGKCSYCHGTGICSKCGGSGYQ